MDKNKDKFDESQDLPEWDELPDELDIGDNFDENSYAELKRTYLALSKCISLHQEQRYNITKDKDSDEIFKIYMHYENLIDEIVRTKSNGRFSYLANKYKLSSFESIKHLLESKLNIENRDENFYDNLEEERRNLRQLHKETLLNISNLKKRKKELLEKISALKIKAELSEDEKVQLTEAQKNLEDINADIHIQNFIRANTWADLSGMPTFENIKLEKRKLKANNPNSKKVLKQAKGHQSTPKQPNMEQVQAPDEQPPMEPIQAPIEQSSTEQQVQAPVEQPFVESVQISTTQPSVKQSAQAHTDIVRYGDEAYIVSEKNNATITEAINTFKAEGKDIGVAGTRFSYVKPVIKNGRVVSCDFVIEDLSNKKYKGLFQFVNDPLRVYKIALKEKIREIEQLKYYETEPKKLKEVKKNLLQAFKDDLKNENYNSCVEKMIAIRSAYSREHFSSIIEKNEYTCGPYFASKISLANSGDTTFPPHLNPKYNKVLKFSNNQKDRIVKANCSEDVDKENLSEQLEKSSRSMRHFGMRTFRNNSLNQPTSANRAERHYRSNRRKEKEPEERGH